MTRFRADLALVFSAAVWGLAFVFQKSAMSYISPLAFIAARGIIAALVLAPLAWREASRAAGPAGPGLTRIALAGGAAFFAAAWLQQAGLVTAT